MTVRARCFCIPINACIDVFRASKHQVIKISTYQIRKVSEYRIRKAIERENDASVFLSLPVS